MQARDVNNESLSKWRSYWDKNRGYGTTAAAGGSEMDIYVAEATEDVRRTGVIAGGEGKAPKGEQILQRKVNY
jgi:hypothetical protein